jgi:hypothetical protein
MILRWSPFKIVSVSAVLYPRWPPLLKIEILGYRTALTDTILKGVHLRIISAKFGWNWLSSFRGEEFELYKHNDELFNIYYGIFYELWTFTDFDRLCKLEKRGDEIKKIFPSETTYSSNLGTFWLKIEQFWPFEEISIFSNGGHLGYRTMLTDTILKGDHLRIISAKFGWDWLSSDELFNIYYGFFMNFELLPILTDYEIRKKGGWN